MIIRSVSRKGVIVRKVKMKKAAKPKTVAKSTTATGSMRESVRNSAKPIVDKDASEFVRGDEAVGLQTCSRCDGKGIDPEIAGCWCDCCGGTGEELF